MTYGTKKAVRIRIGLREDDTSEDAEIEECLAYADDWIDSLFAQLDQTVPSPTPSHIANAAEDLAAYFYFRHRDPSKATVYKDDGLRAVNDYLTAEYGKAVVKRHGREHFETT